MPLAAGPDRDNVVVWRAVPRVEADGPAEVEVLLCAGPPVVGVGTFERLCRDPRPAAGLLPGSGPVGAELTLVVRSLGATRVEVSGVDITYRAGLRVGHEHTGDRFVVDYRPAG